MLSPQAVGQTVTITLLTLPPPKGIQHSSKSAQGEKGAHSCACKPLAICCPQARHPGLRAWVSHWFWHHQNSKHSDMFQGNLCY